MSTCDSGAGADQALAGLLALANSAARSTAAVKAFAVAFTLASKERLPVDASPSSELAPA